MVIMEASFAGFRTLFLFIGGAAAKD